MLDCAIQVLDSGRIHHFVPRWHGSPIRYSNVIRRWQEDEAFRSYFLSLLSSVEFHAYRWETPPVSATIDPEFEFVLISALGVDRAPDARPFAEQFRSANRQEQVLAFPNLGNDAVLVVPFALGLAEGYGHLKAFVRNAPTSQQHELWRVVGATMQARIGPKPVWLNTAGMGVPWLHIRLDSRPKYYGFDAYRNGG